MRGQLCSSLCLSVIAAAVPLAQRAPSPNRAGEVGITAGAAISGHVTDAKSAPVANYSVVVFSTDRSTWSASSRFLRLVRPTQDGSFETTGVPPGEYWVAATDPVDGNDVSGDWLKPETLERLSFRATRVTLAARQRVMTVLRLIRK